MRWSTLHYISNAMKATMVFDHDNFWEAAIEKIQMRSFAHEVVTCGKDYSEQLFDGSKEKVLKFLKLTGNLDSKLPQDKVYRLYSIFRKMNIYLPDPDYSEPLENVLENLTRSILMRCG